MFSFSGCSPRDRKLAGSQRCALQVRGRLSFFWRESYVKKWKCKVMICILADCFTDSLLRSKNSTSQNLGPHVAAVATKEENVITLCDCCHGPDGQKRTRNIDLMPGPGCMPFVRRWAWGKVLGRIRGRGPQKVSAALLLYSETRNICRGSIAQSLWLQNQYFMPIE
jgi:hypothetical protein